MNRRKALAALGMAGLAAGTSHADHGKAPAANGKSPPEQMHLYLCAYHIAKMNPSFVVEAHHYCSPVRNDVHQCIIFDKHGAGARILGVEYIISDAIYRKLPDGEKKYYHPHTYEITAGLLIAPGMEPAAEDKLMAGLVTTWGKTWHTWPDPATDLPMGEPLLMWAATKDGQIPPATLETRDMQHKVSTKGLQKRRSFIGPIPQIDAPKSVDDIGRQWTNSGEDKPRR